MGQRRFAIARDIFDVHFILQQTIDREEALKILPEKCRVKDLEIESFSVNTLLKRKDAYQRDWERNFLYLLPSALKIEFDAAWEAVVEVMSTLLRSFP